MIGILLIASVLGFWAVVPLATSAISSLHALPSQPAIWGNLSSVLLVSLGMLYFLPLCYRYYQRYFSHNTASIFPQSFTHFQKVRWLYPSLVFIVTLLASSSYGLYQFYQYQSQILTTPITVKATIRSLKISDNLSASFVVENSTQKTADSPLTIGNGFQRQLWQIEQVQPFTGNAPTDDDTEEQTDTQNSETQSSAKTLPNFTLPMPVLVTANTVKNPDWQIILNALQPNQTAMVTLALQPIEQPQNTNLLIDNTRIQKLNLGFDEASWLRQRGILAKAQLIDITSQASTSNNIGFWQTLGLKIEQFRWQFRQKILMTIQHNLYSDGKKFTQQNTDTLNANAILLGLLTGDSGLMDNDLKHRYQVTGISHLLAISSPHVMMLASMVAFVVLVLIKRFLPRMLLRLPARLVLLWVSVVVSFIYALFVGFELPAQRTFWMLCVVTLAMQWLLPLSAYRVLAIVGLWMMWLDTTAAGQAGFWLSFVAVALLIKFSQAFQPAVSYDMPDENLIIRLKDNAWHGFKELLLLQLWLFVLMMPVVVWFFGKISLLSVLVNLFAVPFLGLVIVPLDMLAGLISLLPIVGDWLSTGLWKLLASALTLFHHGLDYFITHGWARQSYWAFGSAQMLLLALAGVPWLLDSQRLRDWRTSGVILPKWLSLPVLLAVIALAVVKPADLGENNTLPASNSVNKLIVLDETRISVSLFIQGNQAWLLLADNQYNTETALPITASNTLENPNENSDEPTSRKKRSRGFPAAPLSDRTMTEMLDNKIYPLLTRFGVTQLTGVVSQTPSLPVNHLVQQLANTVRVQRYWLAGFDPLQPLDNQQYANITPNPCPALTLTALTPTENIPTTKVSAILPIANTNTPNDPHSLWAQHSCSIRFEVTSANPIYKENFLPRSVLILAGDKALEPSTNLTLPQTDMLVAPVTTPLTSDVLQHLQPTLVHIISGRYTQGQLSEASQFAVTGWQTDNAKAHPNAPSVQILQSGQMGTLVYRFAP